MNWQTPIIAILAAAVGAIGTYTFIAPSRYQIIVVRAPYNPETALTTSIEDPNAPSLHETIMADTATGKTWRLKAITFADMKRAKDLARLIPDAWEPIYYEIDAAPPPKLGQRSPN